MLNSVQLQRKQNSISRTAILDKIFFTLCCVMGVLLLIRDVGGVNISKWVFLALAVFVFLLYDINYTAVFICFLIPFIVGLPNSYLFLAGLIIFIGKFNNKLVINKYILVLMVIFIIEFLSFIYGNFSIGNYIRLIAPMLFISLIIFNDKVYLDYKKMLLYFIFAAVIAELSIVLQSNGTNGINSLISSGLRLGNTSQLLFDEGMRVSYNPNGLAQLCAISISILLVLLSRNTKHKSIIIALIVFQIFIGSMSLSRLFVVLLVIIAPIYVLSLAKTMRKFLKSLVIIIIIIIGVYASINYYAPSLFESYSSRFAEEDISNGRLDIMASYFYVLAQHPERIFLGVGLQDYNKKYDIIASCHNGTQEILITWGVVGLILVASYILGIYKYGWREVSKKDRKIIYLLPLIILLVGTQSGQFFSLSIVPMYFLPMYATLRLARIKS